MPANNSKSGFGYFPASFFTAFTTVPGFQSQETFFDEDIRKIFKAYKSGLGSMHRRANGGNTRASRKDDFLFRPIPYCLFGEFDLAVFSMIDDFSFATQHFKPPPHSSGFKYQINSGIIPLVGVYNEDLETLSEFQTVTLPAFFREEERYPFTGIASIKLNSAMLVGIGQDFLDLINFYLIAYLDREIEKRKKKGVKMFFILNENLGWNELAIYFFGNAMSVFQELLMNFRQVRLADIKNDLESLVGQEKYDQQKLTTKILPIFDEMKKKSLLSALIKKKKNKKIDIFESHPVIATSITYGFRIELISMQKKQAAIKTWCNFDKSQMARYNQEIDKAPFISIGWKIKPGHENAANTLIKSCFPGSKGTIMNETFSGKYPFSFPKRPMTFRQYFEYAYRGKAIPSHDKALHIIKIRSVLKWKGIKSLNSYNEKKHHIYNFNKYRISKAEIKQIQELLFIHPIPYTFKYQIESLITNYNDAISDPLMYSYFIGLKQSLFNFIKENFDKTIFERVKKPATKPVVPRLRRAGLTFESIERRDKNAVFSISISSLDTDNITEFIQNWNKAYWNRYFHSYYFTEINDFNIEHHGGIQQILFAYDTIYRLISKRIYGTFSKVPFVNVQVGPSITSSKYYNTINFTHLFRPGVYACECVHEAANHVLQVLIDSRSGQKFTFLLAHATNKMDAEFDKNLVEMETRLLANVGPRDEAEKQYLVEHFGLNSIRHIITDFSTYILGYADTGVMDKSELWKKKDWTSLQLFYHTHWYLFLVRSDLYSREDKGRGYWFFKESDFQAIFVRFNLMFYLFMDLTEDELEKLNAQCPSTELQKLWQSEKKRLLLLVKRLGSAIELEFKLKAKGEKLASNDKHAAIHSLRDMIVTNVLESGWADLSIEQRKQFHEAIKCNQKIIKQFNAVFTEGTEKYNTILRRSEKRPVPKSSSVKANIDFYKPGNTRTVYLDPKGDIFVTSPDARTNILLNNVEYIKEIWHLSCKISLKDYK